MAIRLDELKHDAASLHRFIQQIEQFTREQHSGQKYTESTTTLLRYLSELATGSKRFISHQIDWASPSPDKVMAARSDFQDLRDYRELLHTLIKPATEAHLLQVPAQLLDLASSQLQAVQGMQDSRFVVLLTPALMYFQRPHSGIRKAADELAASIPEARFPRKLGFVELPHSQGSSFFSNLVLYHELGHFVFEEIAETRNEVLQLDSEIRSTLSRRLGARFDSLGIAQKAFSVNMLWSWMHEIFCDRFALRLIGPAFSFACTEVFTLVGALRGNIHLRFTESHPSVAARFKHQVEYLKGEGWWDTVPVMRIDRQSLLAGIASDSPNSVLYLDNQMTNDPGFIQAFRDIVPSVNSLVDQLTSDASVSPKDFRDYQGEIINALSNGIVPSARPFGSRPPCPPPVAIINASFCFYLNQFADLVDELRKPRESESEARSYWCSRLEQWTMKALEDYRLLEGQPLENA